MSCPICLSENCESGCCNIGYDILQSLQYGLNVKISDIGDSYSMRLKEGYSCSPNDFTPSHMLGSRSNDGISKNGELLIEYKLIKNLLHTISRELNNLYTDTKSCLCMDTICKIKDKAIEILGVNCFDECRKDIKVDSTDEQEWISQNPYCVSREKWEENLYRVCNDMQISISVVKQKCDILFDIVKEYQNCDITYDFDSEFKDCKIEYSLLSIPQNCDITYHIFSTLRNCGISYNLIEKAINCGITFDVDRVNNCPIIVTIEGGYSLCNTEQDQNEQLRNIIKTFNLN